MKNMLFRKKNINRIYIARYINKSIDVKGYNVMSATKSRLWILDTDRSFNIIRDDLNKLSTRHINEVHATSEKKAIKVLFNHLEERIKYHEQYRHDLVSKAMQQAMDNYNDTPSAMGEYLSR